VKRILVVDDDPGIRESLTMAFESMCEVLTTGSIATGLGIIEATAVDLVILDYHFPDGRGDDALRSIKKRWPWLPVIVITASGTESLGAHLRWLGAHTCFPKPYDVPTLQNAVKQCLDLPTEK